MMEPMGSLGPVMIRPSDPLPSPERSDPEGLVAIGTDLSVPRLLEAYTKGMFPWYEEGLPVMWWSPDPRAVLEFDEFHVPRRLKRTIRSGKFHVTFDRCFRTVMESCAEVHGPGLWITSEMIEVYTELHKAGFAHSVEVWSGSNLAGGLYGVSIGGFFAAESKFYRERDASKVALVALVERLRERGFCLLDMQILNPHTERFGAKNIPRSEYLRRLAEAIQLDVRF